jgi:hypothetical protein
MAFAPWSPPQIRAELPTSRLLIVLHSKVATAPEAARNPAPIEKAEPGFVSESPTAASEFFVAGSLDQFQVVGHCLFTLAAAFLGSGIAGWFYRTDLASG